jgi:CheY-like chemotaxis protein
LPDKSLKDMRILIMEDEFLIAMDVEQLCHDHGAEEVVILRTLKEVVDGTVEPAKFSVAVVDLMLSGESTTEFAKTLQANATPFVFATGYAEDETLFADFPGIAVVSKPYTGPMLISAIMAAVGRESASCGV